MKTKNFFAILMIASALAISVVVISKKAQAQNTSPRTTDKTSATTADAVGTKENNQESPPIFVTEMPPGYRDWRLISVAREEGSLDDIRAVLGNDMAIKAYREGTLPFPEGTIIARIAWSFDTSEENNKTFGKAQSFVAGNPKNGVQFMVKDAKNTPRPAAGDMRSLTTANPPLRQ